MRFIRPRGHPVCGRTSSAADSVSFFRLNGDRSTRNERTSTVTKVLWIVGRELQVELSTSPTAPGPASQRTIDSHLRGVSFFRENDQTDASLAPEATGAYWISAVALPVMSFSCPNVAKLVLVFTVLISAYTTLRFKNGQLNFTSGNSTAIFSWKDKDVNQSSSSLTIETDSTAVKNTADTEKLLLVKEEPAASFSSNSTKVSTYVSPDNSTTVPKDDTDQKSAQKKSRVPSHAPNFTALGKDGRLLDLPSDFKICRLSKTPVIGDSSTGYKCAGKPYDDFMQLHQFPLVMKKYADHASRNSSADPNKQPLMWGRRPSIFPFQEEKNSTKNTTVLLLGNSHTRQFYDALQCQYASQFVGRRLLVRSTVTAINVFQYTFQKDHATYVNFNSITNHPTVYSHRWKDNLESLTGTSLPDYDVIVLGHTNEYDPRYARAANLWIRARSYAQKHPREEIDFEHHPHGPTVAEIAKHYRDGPIVYVSMFANYTQRKYVQAVNEMERLKKSRLDNGAGLRAINARRYTNEMGGEECSSDSHTHVVTCAPRGTPSYQDGHRCMGEKGGQPDLLVWDFIEVLWELFG